MKPFTAHAFILFFCLCIVAQQRAHTQTVALDSLLVKAFASDTLLPMLIDSAIKFSPEARKARGLELSAGLTKKINRNVIFDGVSMHSGYGYGTNYSAINNQSAVVGNYLTTSQSAFYNVGIGIQLPLSMLLNRKNMLKMQNALVETATAQKDNSELLVRQDVINLYQDFKLSQKLLIISSKNKQAAEVNNTIAQKDFLNAQLTVDQQSGVMEKYNKSVIDFETNVIKFQTSLLLLEAYTGTNLSKLIRKLQ
jgi:outer membrane protein TolC